MIDYQFMYRPNTMSDRQLETTTAIVESRLPVDQKTLLIQSVWQQKNPTPELYTLETMRFVFNFRQGYFRWKFCGDVILRYGPEDLVTELYDQAECLVLDLPGIIATTPDDWRVRLFLDWIDKKYLYIIDHHTRCELYYQFIRQGLDPASLPIDWMDLQFDQQKAEQIMRAREVLGPTSDKFPTNIKYFDIKMTEWLSYHFQNNRITIYNTSSGEPSITGYDLKFWLNLGVKCKKTQDYETPSHFSLYNYLLNGDYIRLVVEYN